MTEVATIEPREQRVATQQDQGHAMLSLVERAMADPNFDPDKLQKLLEMKERYEANEARKAYTAAMAQFKSDPPQIVKDAHVKFQNSRGTLTEYDHVTLGSLCKAVITGLAHVGISHDWRLEELEGRRIRVTCVLTHAMGHSERFPSISAAPDDSGGKNAIQAGQSAVTYLQRSTLFAATGLAAIAGPDDDAQRAAKLPGVEYITDEQAADLEALIQESGRSRDKFDAFLASIGIASVELIPANAFGMVCRETRRAAKNADDKKRQTAPLREGCLR